MEGLAGALAPRFARPPRALAKALAESMYRRGKLEREEILTDAGVGRERRALIDEVLELGPLLTLEREISAEGDGCRRLVLGVRRLSRLGRAPAIEAVVIPRRDDLTLCLSSQVGCALACTFCATGMLGFRSNLTAGEILEQHAWAERRSGRRVTDVVFMGMGEPLLNYDAVLESAYRLTRSEGAQISPRRIVLSTVGVVPRIRQYTRECHPFALFFSLTSALPEKRLRLMPIEATYPLAELKDAIREHVASRRRNRYATLEYVAIPGETMGEEDIEALRKFVTGIPAIINVIPYNAVGGRFRAPTWSEVWEFNRALRSLGVPIRTRYSSGKQVSAGCGQLAADQLATAGLEGHMAAPPGLFTDLTA